MCSPTLLILKIIRLHYFFYHSDRFFLVIIDIVIFYILIIYNSQQLQLHVCFEIGSRETESEGVLKVLIFCMYYFIL